MVKRYCSECKYFRIYCNDWFDNQVCLSPNNYEGHYNYMRRWVENKLLPDVKNRLNDCRDFYPNRRVRFARWREKLIKSIKDIIKSG